MNKFLIGIDLSFIRPDHKNGGIETYIKNLMHGFENLNYANDILYFIREDIYYSYHIEFEKSDFYIYKSRLRHKLGMLCIVKKYGIKLVFEPTYTSGFFHFLGI